MHVCVYVYMYIYYVDSLNGHICACVYVYIYVNIRCVIVHIRRHIHINTCIKVCIIDVYWIVDVHCIVCNAHLCIG